MEGGERWDGETQLTRRTLGAVGWVGGEGRGEEGEKGDRCGLERRGKEEEEKWENLLGKGTTNSRSCWIE